MSHAFGILTTFLSAFFSSKFFAKVWQLRMNLRAALFLPFYWQLFPQHFLCRLSYFRHLFWWGTLARRFLSVKDQFPNLPLPSEIAQHWPDGGIKLPIWQTITDQRYQMREYENDTKWDNINANLMKQFRCPKSLRVIWNLDCN